MTRQAPRDFHRSRVPADVLRQSGGLEAEVAQRPRYAIRRVIADQKSGSRSSSIDDLAGGWLVGGQQCRSRPCARRSKADRAGGSTWLHSNKPFSSAEPAGYPSCAAVWIRDPGRGRVPPVPGRLRSSPRIPTTLPDHAKANGKRFHLGYILGGGLAGIHASMAREAAREA